MQLREIVDAGLARRIAALCLDAVLLAAAFAFGNLLLFKIGVLHALRADADAALLSVWPRPELAVPAAVAVVAAVLAAWRLQGGTPGALLMGVVVVSRRDGRRPRWWQCAARLGVALALGGAGILWSAGGRAALHDRFSATRAVLEDESLLPLATLRGSCPP